MGRILLSICAVVVAGAFAGLAPEGHAQPQKAQPTQERPQGQAPAAANEGKGGDQLTAACRPGENNRQSDLCAQWKAADSAAQAAVWTKYGVGVGFLTMIAATIAALYARLASNHTRDGAKAAWAAEKVTRESAEKQLRAYLGVLSVDNEELTEGEFSVTVTLKNFGQTPAYGMKTRCGFGAGPAYPDDEPRMGPASVATDLMPQAQTIFPFHFSSANGPVAKALAGEFKMWLAGEAAYTDAFGEPQRFSFHYRWSAKYGRFGPSVDFPLDP